VARAVWAPAPDLGTAAQAWLTAGGPHHTVLTTAVDYQTLADLAQFAGIELLLIDEHTTPAAFADALRWNAAYYRTASR
jgi:L-arabinose isomerase